MRAYIAVGLKAAKEGLRPGAVDLLGSSRRRNTEESADKKVSVHRHMRQLRLSVK